MSSRAPTRVKQKIRHLNSLVTTQGTSRNSVVSESEAPEPEATSSETDTTDFSTIDSFIHKVRRQDMTNLTQKFAEALYYGNIQYTFVENPYLIDFFKSLGYINILPTRKELSGSHLQKADKKCRDIISEKINNSSCVTIIIDGSTNICQRPVTIIMLAEPEGIYYKCSESSGQHHDSKFIVDTINEVIKDVGKDKIAAVMADNASAMVCAQNILTTECPSIIRVNCAAHILNLLIKDIFKIESLSNLITKVKQIVKHIKYSHVRLGRYQEAFRKYISDEKEKGRIIYMTSLGVYSDIRWFGVKDMLTNFIKARTVLQRMAIDLYYELDYDISRMLKCDDFWDQVNKEEIFLTPLIEGM